MDLLSLFTGLEASPIGVFVKDRGATFALIEAVHLMALLPGIRSYLDDRKAFQRHGGQDKGEESPTLGRALAGTRPRREPEPRPRGSRRRPQRRGGSGGREPPGILPAGEAA